MDNNLAYVRALRHFQRTETSHCAFSRFSSRQKAGKRMERSARLWTCRWWLIAAPHIICMSETNLDCDVTKIYNICLRNSSLFSVADIKTIHVLDERNEFLFSYLPNFSMDTHTFLKIAQHSLAIMRSIEDMDSVISMIVGDAVRRKRRTCAPFVRLCVLLLYLRAYALPARLTGVENSASRSCTIRRWPDSVFGVISFCT